MALLYNIARMNTSTTGTGTVTLGSASGGFLSFADAGVSDGETVTYCIREGNNQEVGRGVYTAVGTTLTRSVLKSTNSDSEINLAGDALVAIVAAAEDMNPDIAALAVTDGNFIVGNGSEWVAENGATARASLGLTIGTNVQAYDAGLASIAGLTTAADKMIYTTALDTYAVTDLTAFARSILDDANEATFKATVNLEIGTDVQAYDAGLTSIAGLTTAADKMIYTTALDTYAVTDLTAFARSILDDANEATFKATVNLEIGTDVQAYGAVLDDLNTLGVAASDGQFIVATGAGAFAYESGATVRTSLGLGTGDSPQFTAVNIGHASDTTVSRPSAGNIAVEGNLVYRAGGTDVPIADGGTGASTAATAFSNLKQNATTSATGVVELATAAEVRAATTGKALTTDIIDSAAETVALSDAATVAVNWSAGINFTLTVTANRTLGNPTNEEPGQYRTVLIAGNDGTSRTLSFGSEYGGTVPTLTDITSTQKYLLTIYCKSASQFLITSIDGTDA